MRGFKPEKTSVCGFWSAPFSREFRMRWRCLSVLLALQCAAVVHGGTVSLYFTTGQVPEGDGSPLVSPAVWGAAVPASAFWRCRRRPPLRRCTRTCNVSFVAFPAAVWRCCAMPRRARRVSPRCALGVLDWLPAPTRTSRSALCSSVSLEFLHAVCDDVCTGHRARDGVCAVRCCGC